MLQQHIIPPADMALPDSLTLMQLLNLSLKTPDYGVVNFRSLYVLLEYLINRMNIAQDRVDLRERPSREFLREAGRGMADGGMRNMMNGVVDYREGSEDGATGGSLQSQVPFRTPSITSFSNQQRISVLEDKVGNLRSQLEAYTGVPFTGGFSENPDGGGQASFGSQPNTGFTFNIFEPAKRSLAGDDNGTPGASDPATQPRTSGPVQPRISGPTNDWPLGKRMAAAEQNIEQAFGLINDILQRLGNMTNLKDNLVNYIRKWMINPDAAFQDAINGDILGGNLPEDFVVPQQVTKLPFVTWPALRSVLVDRQIEDAKLSMVPGGGAGSLAASGGGRSRSPSNSARSLSPISEHTESRSKPTKRSDPRLADDQTSTRSEEERNKVSTGTNRSTPDSHSSRSTGSGSIRSGKSDKVRVGSSERSLEITRLTENQSGPGTGTVDETVPTQAETAVIQDGVERDRLLTGSDADETGTVPVVTGTEEERTLPQIDAKNVTDQNQNNESQKLSLSDKAKIGEASEGEATSDEEDMKSKDGAESDGSQRRSDSTRRSTPLSLILAGQPGTPTFEEMQTLSPNLESPTFLSEPDTDVLDSLVQIGRLVRTSHRFEKRLARIEAYLNGLARKKDFNRLTQGLRGDMDEFRRSLSPALAASGLPGWTAELGAEDRPTDGTDFESDALSPDGDDSGQQDGLYNRDREGTDLTDGTNSTAEGLYGPDGAHLDTAGRMGSGGGGGRSGSAGAESSFSPGGMLQAGSARRSRPGSGSPSTWQGGIPPAPLSPLSGLDHTFRPVASGEGPASLEHIRELQKVMEKQKKNWERMQNRVNTLHTELATVTTKLKEQALKMAGASSRVMIHPQFHHDAKMERAVGGFNGPTRSEFEIFCRACAENFEMIEIRLTELENLMRNQQSKLEVLQFQSTRLQREKADELVMTELLLPKADAKLLDNKLDKAHFMEFANLLQQKLLDIRGNMLQQGDFLGNHIKAVSERMESQLNTEMMERKVEEADKDLNLLKRRLILVEKLLQMDSAAGSKKPIRAYTCVSCDKPIDPTPNEKPSGWPHAYVTSSVRPHLEYMKHQMIDNWDGNQRIGELKYKNVSLGKRFQRHLREQECIEWKDAANHLRNSTFPHCNHQETRPVGGKHTLLNNQDFQSAKTTKRSLEERLDSFVKRNSLQLQLQQSGKDVGPFRDIPGFPDMRVGQLRKPKSADSLIGAKRRSGYDAKSLRPGIQSRLGGKRTATVPPLAIEPPRQSRPATPHGPRIPTTNFAPAIPSIELTAPSLSTMASAVGHPFDVGSQLNTENVTMPVDTTFAVASMNSINHDSDAAASVVVVDIVPEQPPLDELP